MVKDNATTVERQSDPGSRRPLWLNILLTLVAIVAILIFLACSAFFVLFVWVMYTLSSASGL